MCYTSPSAKWIIDLPSSKTILMICSSSISLRWHTLTHVSVVYAFKRYRKAVDVLDAALMAFLLCFTDAMLLATPIMTFNDPQFWCPTFNVFLCWSHLPSGLLHHARIGGIATSARLLAGRSGIIVLLQFVFEEGQLVLQILLTASRPQKNLGQVTNS